MPNDGYKYIIKRQKRVNERKVSIGGVFKVPATCHKASQI